MLFGDTSDNYKGPLGEKLASDLLNQYETIDTIYANLDKIKNATANKIRTWYEDKEKYELARKMALIDTNIKIDRDISIYQKKSTN